MNLSEIKHYAERQRHDADLLLGLLSEREKAVAEAQKQAALAEQRAKAIDELKRELEQADGGSEPPAD